MLTIVTIAARIVFALGLVVGFFSPMLSSASPGWRRAGFTAAIVAAVVLVGLRIAMRLTTPEQLPSSSG